MSAKTLKYAIEHGLALHIRRDDYNPEYRNDCNNDYHSVSFFLYDAKHINSVFNNIKKYYREIYPNLNKKIKHITKKNMSNMFFSPFCGYAFLNISHEYDDNDIGFYRVKGSYAREGYGPLIYDIGLSYAGDKGIMPDNSISSHAKKIWKHYYNKRNDVIPYEIKCEVSNSFHKEKYLSYVYEIENKKKYYPLVKKHKYIFNKMSQFTGDEVLIMEEFDQMSSNFMF